MNTCFIRPLIFINGSFWRRKNIYVLLVLNIFKTHFLFWKLCIWDYCQAENMPINTSACKDAHIWKTIFGPRCKDLTVRMPSELYVIFIYLLKVAGIDANWSLFISQCTGPWDEIIDKALWRISRLLLWLRTWNVHKHLKVDHFVNPAQCTRYLITLFCGDSFIFVAGAWTLLWLLLWPHNCYLNSLRAFYGQLLPHKVDSEASRVTRVTCGRVSVLARVCQENWFVTRFCFLALRPVFSSQHFHH